jgi:hypothetical protein
MLASLSPGDVADIELGSAKLPVMLSSGAKQPALGQSGFAPVDH